jgi:uncharacterized membrane protein
MSTNPFDPAGPGATGHGEATPPVNPGAEPIYGPAYTAAHTGEPGRVPPHAPQAAPSYGEAPGYTAPYPPYPSDPPQAQGIAPNMAAGLAYFTVIPAVFFLLLEPYRSNAMVRFHSWQSVFFFITVALVRVLETIVIAVLPIAVAVAIDDVMWLVLVIGWLIAVIKAFQGDRWQLPYLGPFAARTAESGRI